MKKEDFKLGNEKYYIDDDYVYDNKDYIMIISEFVFDDETVEYASKIGEKYVQERENIINHMLDGGLRDFYSSRYSDEEIKEKIGRPQISILFKKDEEHPNYKFQYSGIIDFCERNLDEHVISIEFIDDLKLDEDIQING